MKNPRHVLLPLAALCAALSLGETVAAEPAAPVILLVHIPLKKEAYSSFLPVMQNNVKASRQEAGNESFDAYQPENGEDEVILVERWKSQAALDTHNVTPHLGAVKEAFQQDARPGQGMNIAKLRALSSAAHESTIASPATTHNVVAVLNAKPEALATLKQALLNVVAPSRAAPGNLQFDVFEDLADVNRLVLVERWENAAQYQAHLEQPYSQPVKAVLETSLAQPLRSDQISMRDVAQ